MDENNKRKIILYGLLSLVAIIVGVLGATYAYFTSQVGTYNEQLVTTGTLQIRYSQGTTVIADNLKPATTTQVKNAYTEGNCLYTDDVANGITDEQICAYNTFTITNTGSLASKATAILTDITNTYANLKYEVFEGTSAPNTLTGNLIGTTGSLVGFPRDIIIPSTTNNTKTYTLLLWLDENATLETDADKSYTATITVNAIQSNDTYYVDASNANAPTLAEGMIPVMHDGTNWVKADYYDSTSEYAGYDYQNKEWANAVTVTSETRDTYMSNAVGTEVLETDILSYYTWIPRYKYQLFTADYTSSVPAQQINVVFESGTSTTGTVTCTYSETGAETCTNKAVGNYYTHPAFTLGNQELTGIWVGKFETTGTGTIPTIKPNVSPLTNQNVSTQFATAKILGTNTYLTDNGIGQTDSHMMKNIEWGAVAYLKQSAYGLGTTNIGINNYVNSNSFNTGCGATSDSPESTTCNQYNTTTGMLASTTGNITGVYDMSGGVYEYVMGNYQKYSGYTAINYTAEQATSILGRTDNIAVGIWNSGFNGPVYGKALDGVTPLFVTNGVPFPENKYYDLYVGSNRTYSHLGDALGETANWYNDNNGYVTFKLPWFVRGGRASGGIDTGSFASHNTNGNANYDFGFRSVLVMG